MTEDTPVPLDHWCPECLEVPPERARALVYCYQHMPALGGADDAAVTVETVSAHNTEAIGADCRAIQALIR